MHYFQLSRIWLWNIVIETFLVCYLQWDLLLSNLFKNDFMSHNITHWKFRYVLINVKTLSRNLLRSAFFMISEAFELYLLFISFRINFDIQEWESHFISVCYWSSFNYLNFFLQTPINLTKLNGCLIRYSKCWLI